MKILCIGPIWRGSNARALFNGFSRLGHAIECIDEFYYIPLRHRTKPAKIWSKIGRNLYVKSYNKEIVRKAIQFKPNLVLIYKGAFISVETLNTLKQNALVVNFYPDVSFYTHGRFLPKTLPMYHQVFTTKTFGVKDLKEQLGQMNAHFVPHGFDPTIHCPNTNSKVLDQYKCDASFIGTWSKHKEDYLTHVIENIPGIKLNIWGGQWKNANPSLKPYIQNYSVFGDLYVQAIQASSINIALMSERVKGASSGDKITSRTFHIPASGGFMLHQNSEEIDTYFDCEKEICVFNTQDDLVAKIKYYLGHPAEREEIKRNGLKRALENHSIDQRASLILNLLDERHI